MANNNYAVYIHIPFCKARCGYCAFSSCVDYSLTEQYFAKLFCEMDCYADKSVKISTVYIGGGTPSSVGAKYLNLLFDKLRGSFDLSNVTEITVECNPESVNAELLECLRNNGVNRLSIGLQSANDETLKRIGRIHCFDDFLRALALARSYGFDNINADLILGLPEAAGDFERTLKAIVKLPLTHISVYALELYPDSHIFHICKTQYNFSDDELADMYDVACNTLVACGFERYETSNFSKIGFECKHNLNYWTEGRYFAFGAAASGFVGDTRFTNVYDIHDYLSCDVSNLKADCETLSNFEQANEFVMLGLRLDCGISLDEFYSRYKTDFWQFFERARNLERRGFLAVKNGRVAIPPDKSYVTNSILSELLTF